MSRRSTVSGPCSGGLLVWSGSQKVAAGASTILDRLDHPGASRLIAASICTVQTHTAGARFRATATDLHGNVGVSNSTVLIHNEGKTLGSGVGVAWTNDAATQATRSAIKDTQIDFMASAAGAAAPIYGFHLFTVMRTHRYTDSGFAATGGPN